MQTLKECLLGVNTPPWDLNMPRLHSIHLGPEDLSLGNSRHPEFLDCI
jgi:hypothetical protein